jgi:putative methionine-R-sulfoxide reductase with GAF domain
VSAISRGGKLRVLGRVAFIASYVWIPVSAHFGLKAPPITWLALVTFVGGLLLKAVKATAPEGITYLRTNYTQRKYALSAMLDKVYRHRDMNPSEVQAYRQEVLQVITQYVRDHRGDWGGRSIFANLLVPDGDEIVVLARNQEHRKAKVRCQKRDMLSTEVFETGEIFVVGDLQSEHPGSPKKPYSSFMVMPIRLGTMIVGAVSVDSAEKYRFDFEADDLAIGLLPYLKLLAWTLSPARVREAL